MAAPTFVQASAGTVVTTGTSTISLTGCVAGNVVFLVWLEDGTPSDSSTGNHVNTKWISTGATSDLEFFQLKQVGTVASGWLAAYVGRVMANGTVSADLTVGASGHDLFAQWYEFTGVTGREAPLNSQSISENVHFVSTDYYLESNGAGTSVDFQFCDSQGPDRFAVTLIAVNANQAFSSATGESGGDWTLRSSFSSGSGTAGSVGLQTSLQPTAGSISGGSMAISSADWGLLTFALKPPSAEIGWIRG